MSRQRFLNIAIAGMQQPLLLTSISGFEGLSSPFTYRLTVLSKNENLLMKKLLFDNASVSLNKNGKIEYYHGVIDSICQAERANNIYHSYEIVLKPWLACLRYDAASRIYKNKNVLEIIEAEFKYFHAGSYDVSRLRGEYAVRSMCVKHQESAFDFVTRLMSDEGIYYWFTHDKDKHTLVLADALISFETAQAKTHYRDVGLDGEHIFSWRHKYECVSHKVKLLQIEYSQAQCKNKKSLKLALQRLQYQAETVSGKCNIFNLRPGRSFNFSGHPDANECANYALYETYFMAKDLSCTGYHLEHSQAEIEFNLAFKAYPSNVAFIPVCIEKANATSIENALVTAPNGLKVYTDKLACVKLKYPWLTNAANAACSNWVRVLQPWAGEGYGSLFLPRVGQEVLVSYENGDVDKPEVLCTLAKQTHMPAFTPYATPTRLGFKSKSLASDNKKPYSELLFDDKAGHEQLAITAAKDLQINVDGSSTLHIGGSQNMTVWQGDNFTQVFGISEIKAKKSIHLACGDTHVLLEPHQITLQSHKIVFNTS